MNVRLLVLLLLSAFVVDASEDPLPSNILLRFTDLSQTTLNHSFVRDIHHDDHQQFPSADSRWGPLQTKQQILISLSEDYKTKTQEKVISELKVKGGLLVSYVPKRTFLFLGDDAVFHAASSLKEVQWVGPFLPVYKISPEWDPILQLLKTHSLKDLAEHPIHKLHNQTTSESTLLGHVYIEKRSKVSPDTLTAFEGLDEEIYCLVIEVHFPTFHKMKEDLEVNLNSTSFRPAAAAKHDWLPILQKSFGDILQMQAYHGVLEISVPEDSVESILYLLSLQKSIHRLQPKMRIKTHNWLASGIIQSGLAPSEENGQIDEIIHPIWSGGIQGEGQIVGCGDSGMDVDSCFFYDPEVSFLDGLRRLSPFRRVQVFESSVHRKIKYYHGTTDVLDNDGHGTHVAGTLVGDPIDTDIPEAIANKGMAPQAKIAFMDLGGSENQDNNNNEIESDASDSIYTPSELSLHYYPLTYAQGARIHSDSWGSDTPTYDSLAREVDKFVWENQDFLPVFAAGNYGRYSSRFLTTVTSPAVAKNCISVGATLTAGQGMIRYSNTDIKVYRIEIKVSVSQDELEVQEYKILGAQFGSDWSEIFDRSRQEDLELVLGSPVTGCTSLNHRIRGKFVLLQRGECLYVQKLRNAQSQGALGVFVMNNVDAGYFEMQGSGDTSDLTIPMASVPLSIGLQLRNVLESNRRVTIVVKERSEPEHSYDNIAEYSSSGPTTDLRIKPDLVAPGRIKSVFSDGKMSSDPGQCLMKTASGTSMATPVVAGAAILVRQYFIDGYYPTGQKNAEDGYEPSAALIKATLLGGAFSMDGFTEAGLPLDPPPSTRQGFGRVHLETSIPLQSSQKWKEGWRIQVVDKASLQDGQSHKYCVRALGGPLRITLVWTDPPASISAKSVLVNDLDLSVKSAGLRGIELLGNGREDRVNNVERVVLDEMPEGNVAIVVEAHHIVAAYGVQPYALVVQGHFNGILQSPGNPYQSENQNANELCIITLAVLESGPEGPVNDSNPEFVFTTQSGVNPVNGFECKLTDDQDQSSESPPLHNWESCTSPKQYSGLTDGPFIFTVRPKNEDVEVSRSFIVDTEAPMTEISGDPIPSISAQESVEFQFSAEDLTEVSYSCKMEYQGERRWRRSIRILRESTQNSKVNINSWYKCTSPQSFRGLTYGNWTFKIRGEDEAENSQLVPTEYPWSIQFTPNVFYVRIIEAPIEVTSSATLEFEFEVITGDQNGAPVLLQDQLTECRLYQQNQNPAPPFVPCDSVVVYPNITDESYIFQARTQDEGGHQPPSVSSVQFRVDSTAPIVTLMQRPNTYHGAKDVIIKFEADEEVSSFNCSMRPTGATVSFIQCPGNEPGTVDYQLEDGWYVFQAVARDLAGNLGYSEQLNFMIDSKAPQINFEPSESISSKNGSVSFEFQISDEGSGIIDGNTSCTLLNESTQESTLLTDTCTSPVNLELEEGRYLFTIGAVDQAGHNQEQSLQIVIDFTAPIVNWSSPFAEDELHPSFVVFQFNGSDKPDNIASSIRSFECKLDENQQLDQVVRVEFEENGKRRKLRNLDPSSISIRSLLESSNSTSRRRRGSVRIRDGPLLEFDNWTECQSPVVLTEIKTGHYSFQVRAVDFAGNIGDSIIVESFQVDDTLPIPGTEADSGDDLALSLPGIIAIIVGLVLFVLCVCILVVCCRRKQRKARNANRRNEGDANRLVRSSDRRHSTPRVVTGDHARSDVYTDAMLNIATRNSLQNQGPTTRLPLHIEQGDDSQRIQRALEESMEDYRYQEAVKRSLNER